MTKTQDKAKAKAKVEKDAEMPDAPLTVAGMEPADIEDMKSRVAFAKPRNEALIVEVRTKLATAQQRITEASEALENLIHVEA